MIDTMEKLHEALGYPSISNGDSLVDLAVDAIKHTQDLKSGIDIIDGRYAEQVELLAEQVRRSNTKDRLLDIAAQCEIDLRDDFKEVVMDLKAAEDVIVELREYIDLLLRRSDTLRDGLRIIGVIARSDRMEEGHQRTVALQLVNKVLAGDYYD